MTTVTQTNVTTKVRRDLQILVLLRHLLSRELFSLMSNVIEPSQIPAEQEWAGCLKMHVLYMTLRHERSIQAASVALDGGKSIAARVGQELSQLAWIECLLIERPLASLGILEDLSFRDKDSSTSSLRYPHR